MNFQRQRRLVALKKPNELFEQEKSSPKKSVREDFSDIKKDLDKVDNLRDQIDTVSNSINNSLADVLDKNINSLSEEYNLQIKKFNKTHWWSSNLVQGCL